jgi:hypothetical protein
MWRLATIAGLGFVLGVACAGTARSDVAPAARAAIDVEKPDSWDAAVNAADEHRAAIVKALTAVVADKKRPPEARQKAVALLGQMNDRAALSFLIDNVSLNIPVQFIQSGDLTAAFQCQYALGKGNWFTVQTILESLGKERPEQDVRRLCFAAMRVLPKEVLAAVTDRELHQDRFGPVGRKNLTAWKVILTQN